MGKNNPMSKEEGPELVALAHVTNMWLTDALGRAARGRRHGDGRKVQRRFPKVGTLDRQLVITHLPSQC